MTGDIPSPEEIKVARTKLGLTQTAFAQKVGVSKREVIRWEAGIHRPRGLALKGLRRWVRKGEGHD